MSFDKRNVYISLLGIDSIRDGIAKSNVIHIFGFSRYFQTFFQEIILPVEFSVSAMGVIWVGKSYDQNCFLGK